MQRHERFGNADRVIHIGFWINAFLMVMKLLAGYFGRSEAVFADGLESAADFIALLATMVALKISRQQSDAEHPYGHGKAESVSAFLVSLVIFITGVVILVTSVQSIIHHRTSEPELIAVIAAVLTVLIKEALYRYTSGAGMRLESPALTAIAKDHRKDAITSVATVVGVAGAFYGVGIMDPLAAAVTSIFIFKIAWETFHNAAYDLMDGKPSQDLLAAIVTLAEAVDGVEHVHEIRGRRSGQYLIIDLKLDMPAEMTVKRSHDIAKEVKRRIFNEYSNVGDVMIHINPHNDPDHEDLIRL